MVSEVSNQAAVSGECFEIHTKEDGENIESFQTGLERGKSTEPASSQLPAFSSRVVLSPVKHDELPLEINSGQASFLLEDTPICELEIFSNADNVKTEVSLCGTGEDNFSSQEVLEMKVSEANTLPSGNFLPSLDTEDTSNCNSVDSALLLNSKCFYKGNKDDRSEVVGTLCADISGITLSLSPVRDSSDSEVKIGDLVQESRSSVPHKKNINNFENFFSRNRSKSNRQLYTRERSFSDSSEAYGHTCKTGQKKINFLEKVAIADKGREIIKAPKECLKPDVLDAKIESIRLKNLKILERQKIVEADKEWAIEQNKQYRKLLEEESEGNPDVKHWPSGRPKFFKRGEKVRRNRANSRETDFQWREERRKIDEARIQRQTVLSEDGQAQWAREWDRKKTGAVSRLPQTYDARPINSSGQKKSL